MSAKKLKKAKKPAKVATVPVSERALIQRINRKFATLEDRPAREVKITRGARAKSDFGDFYVLDFKGGGIVAHHVDLEDLGRELEVLADYEHLEGEEN